jgi:coenzyme F420 hydrogenase subunit beta
MGEIEKTVEAGLCLGCGLCASQTVGEGKVVMHMAANGFLRPKVQAPLTPAAEQQFLQVCPGRGMSLRPDPAATVHPVWGPIVESRTAWSTDSEIRYKGSSGGGISALLIHLLSNKQIDFAAQIGVDPVRPLENRIQKSRSKEEVLHAAGSRYAPAAPLANIDQLFEGGERFAFVGKPCDVAGMRAYLKAHPQRSSQVVMLISFMCAGVPSIKGTHEVLAALGTKESEVKKFQYRGDGWPGFATATTNDGQHLKMDYNKSWGQILGKHLQLRCKLCPDGTGESADVVCADAWYGKDGYPDFEERDGRSMLLTRTKLGEACVQAAVQLGRIQVDALPVNDINVIQPYQLTRKQVVLGRLIGFSVMRRMWPRFHNLRLLSNTLSGGIVSALRNGWGTARRLGATENHV